MSRHMQRVAWLGVIGLLAAVIAPLRPAAAAPAATNQAREILQATGVKGGLIVHLGSGGGRLTAALGAGDSYLVHGLDADLANLAKAREHIRKLGLYGKVSVGHLAGKRLPYADNLVNLVVAEGPVGAAAGEIVRVLAPGGVAYTKGADGQWAKTVKPRPAQIDEWTHHLHDAGGNAVAHDRVVGPPRHLQWTAGPRWARSHGYTPSVSAMVSAGGRLFYLCDETLACVDDTVPSQWRLVARDAFSGVLLWKRPVLRWGAPAFSGTSNVGRGVTTGRFTMPPHVGKRLVAVGETVYATLGAGAPVTALDAATGAVRRVYAETARADEVLCTGGRLILSIDPPDDARPPVAERNESPAPPPGKRVRAVDAKSGRVLWTKGPFTGIRAGRGQDPFGRLELAAGDGRVLVLTREAIHALKADSGATIWRIDRPALPEGAVKRLGFAGMYEYLLTVMVYHDGVVLLAQPEPNTHHTYHTMPGTLYAFNAADGKPMWKHAYGAWGHCTPPDVFVVNGVVWTHVHAKTDFGFVWGKGFKAKDASRVNYRIQGLDLRTGEARKELATKDVFNVGHHHRCYRNKITERFLLASRRGVEFVDLATGENHQHHWVRSGCLLGNLPCNGLLYVAPHPCGCYITAKLTGFNALAPAMTRTPAKLADGARLEKGPAYAQVRSRESTIGDEDWPTYRHDARRSGATKTVVGAKLSAAWQADVGTKPSGLVIAGGKVLVAGVDAHTVHALNAADGKAAWSHTADARVDSPPTVHEGRAIFGSADGRVTCLRASDGALAWRFDAAPQRRLAVSFGQLESPWPVPGSVLVHGGRCWFAAGRSSYLDGGIHLFALEPATGKVASRRTIYHADPDTGKMTPEINGHAMEGLLNDIPGTDGADVFIRQMQLTSSGGRRGPHLYTSGGYLDPSWFNRTYWKAGRAQTSGVMVLGKDVAYGVEIYSSRSRETVFKPGASNYRLVCLPLKSTPAAAPAAAVARKKKAKVRRPRRGGAKPIWQQRVAIRITAMVRAGETLFVAGSPDVVDPKDPHGAWEGRKGGVLAAFAAADGKKLAEHKLPAPPVWDGLAAARGRLYVATVDGKITCLAPQ